MAQTGHSITDENPLGNAQGITILVASTYQFEKGAKKKNYQQTPKIVQQKTKFKKRISFNQN